MDDFDSVCERIANVLNADFNTAGSKREFARDIGRLKWWAGMGHVGAQKTVDYLAVNLVCHGKA